MEKNDSIERLLKKFKKKFDKTKVMKELRARQQFEKPSVKKRKVKRTAIYRNDIQKGLDNE